MVHSGINNGFDHLGLTSNAGKLPKLLPKPLPDVKMVYSGNGKLVCANNVFAQWALTLTVKARKFNRLAATRTTRTLGSRRIFTYGCTGSVVLTGCFYDSTEAIIITT